MKRVTLTAVVFSLLLSSVAFADAYGDLRKAQAAFRRAKSWHAEEHFSNGKTVVVDYSAPDRWRLQPTPTMTELVIGSDVYMVRDGHPMKLPFGGMIVSRMIEHFRGVPETLYLGPDSLPVEAVVEDRRMTRVIGYSKYNEPITIEAPPS